MSTHSSVSRPLLHLEIVTEYNSDYEVTRDRILRIGVGGHSWHVDLSRPKRLSSLRYMVYHQYTKYDHRDYEGLYRYFEKEK